MHSTPIIRLKNITKSYYIKDTEYPILRGIDLTIGEGEFVALMGPSGSGKSTLLNIIGALDKPNTGEYLIKERSVAMLSRDELAEIRNSYIGFIFQNFQLVPTLSTWENVMLPSFYAGKDDQAKARELLGLVGMIDRLDNKPNELSGGQRQRVAIARALVNNPEFILADEPTGNLDSKTGAEIMKLILNLKKEYKKTILMVTHDPNIAKLADRIIYLKDGVVTKNKSI